ncbi:PAS domain S-box protein [Desulforhabdus sp. TSK]|uniref:PAS domain S-box protein n=1 Tax=Desulforhabdus sp. TSK TaxID=2925014 RepID=UPI001FC813D1|nr:PAS domain-containing sensor histidine kinase [Desulforhabdus sp. TSK]
MDHFFQQLVDSLSDALITVNQEQSIVVWNRMAETMFGYSREEIQALGLEAIIPEAYRQKHRESYHQFVRTIDSRASYTSPIRQFEALRKDGGLFPVELTHSMVKISPHEYYISAIVRDITMRKRYELMRNRLERITRHDLKNKLVIISLAARRLSSSLGKAEQAQAEKYSEIVQSESQGLIALLDSTRELILLETGEYQRKDTPFDLPALVQSKTEHLQPLAAAKEVSIVFQNRLGREVTLQADRLLLERALENLLKNAIEAEEPRRAVQVILGGSETGAPVLEISNGGKSIPEKIQKDLFTPYVTHGKKGGVGLGLYAAKLIVETIHGWHLAFRSSPGETVFRITFGSSSM